MPTRTVHNDRGLTEVRAESGGEALAETLRQLGVGCLFGVGSPEPMYAALDRDAVRAITVRDERAAAVMADGYARVSDRPGVCTGLNGPGATNLVQGIIEARCASIPVVAIVGETPPGDRYRHALQDVDQHSLFAPITKWAATVGSADRLSALTVHGFATAVAGRPGPVYLGFPLDVLEPTPGGVPCVTAGAACYPSHRVAPDPASVARIAGALASAKRPAIVAGGGVLSSHAGAALQAFAAALAAPVATTPLGKGAVDESDRHSAGVVGGYTGGAVGRGRIANRLVCDADVVVLVGTKTDSVSTDNWSVPDPSATIVHVDIDPAEVGRNYPSSLGLVGDARLAMEALTSALRESHRERAEWALERLDSERRAWREERRPVMESGQVPIRPERVFGEIGKVLTSDTIIATDAGYASAWAVDLLELDGTGRRLITPRGYGSLGWGLPAAIGAKVAAPERPVICVTGDGGFAYVFQELETAARYGLAITTVVLNNSCLGFQKHYEERIFHYPGDSTFLDVEHAMLAQSMHCAGARITHPEDLGDALREALSADRPTVIDVVTDPDALPAVKMFEE